MQLDNLKLALEQFAQDVVLDARENLKKTDSVASSKLYNSIKATPIKVTPKSITFNIEMEKYGTFIDEGVSGIKKKYNTPYAYKDKMPPPKAFDNWIVRKGIAPRSKTGQFESRKQLQFAIARGVYINGIKPTNFLRNAIYKNKKLLPDIVQKKFGLDVKEFVKFIAKQNFKNGNSKS